ncbi:hypothetical protein ACVBEH_24545, partial [Roseateles sp. GG27B]
AARTLFATEFGATLNGLIRSLQPLGERLKRPWDHWLMHAATAALSSATTWALALLWWHK